MIVLHTLGAIRARSAPAAISVSRGVPAARAIEATVFGSEFVYVSEFPTKSTRLVPLGGQLTAGSRLAYTLGR